MVVAAKELDVVVALVEVKSQIAAALRAFQIAAKGAGLLCYGRPPAPGGLQALHLFPSHTVNDRVMDIEEDCPVFLRVFNPTLHLVGLRVGLEVDHIAAVFLQSEDLLNGGMVPLGRLQHAFGAAFADPLTGSIRFPSASSSRISICACAVLLSVLAVSVPARSSSAVMS